MLVGVLIVISGLALWKPVQFSELADLFGSFQTIRLVHFLCMSAIVAFIARARDARIAGAAEPRRHGHRRARRRMTARRAACRPPRSKQRGEAVTRCRYERALHRFFGRAKPSIRACSPKTRALVERLNRRGILRGAVSLGALGHADRLRRQRGRSRAESSARGVGVERWRAGDDLPAEPSGADIFAVAGGQAAAF